MATKAKAHKTKSKKNTKSKAAKKPTVQKAGKSQTSKKTNINFMEMMMTKQNFQFDQFAQEAANQGREGVEAFVKSGTIFAKGFENWMKTAASMTQTAAEKQAEFTKQLMGSKTINEFTEAQNKIAQANFDQFVESATKLSEMGAKVLTDSSAPLNEQMTKAMKNAQSTKAA